MLFIWVNAVILLVRSEKHLLWCLSGDVSWWFCLQIWEVLNNLVVGCRMLFKCWFWTFWSCQLVLNEIWWGCWIVPVNCRMVYAYWSGFWHSYCIKIDESWNRKRLSSCFEIGFRSWPCVYKLWWSANLQYWTCWLHVIALIWHRLLTLSCFKNWCPVASIPTAICCCVGPWI